MAISTIFRSCPSSSTSLFLQSSSYNPSTNPRTSSICFFTDRPSWNSRIPSYSSSSAHLGFFKRGSVLKRAAQDANSEIGGGSGGDDGNKKGGGSGGGENNWEENQEGKGEGESKKMAAMSMSQKLTLGYAALVGAGGIMGYVKGGSQKSLAAGGLSALALLYVYSELSVRPAFASTIGLGISAALLAVMGSRFKRSGKVFPAGVTSIVSFIMAGGYLHGFFRGLH